MPGKNLTRDEAATRADLFAVALLRRRPRPHHRADTFRDDDHGHVHRAPRRSAAPSSTSSPTSVESVTLNGAALDPATHSTAPGSRCPVSPPSNELVVDATGAYMNTGEGLHRFVDPVDDEVYLYTPVRGRRTPGACSPSSSSPTSRPPSPSRSPPPTTGRSCPTPPRRSRARRRPRRDLAATWTFAPTPRISSYITALIAGPVRRRHATSVQRRRGAGPAGRLCRARCSSTWTPTTSSTAPSRVSSSSRPSSTRATRSRSTTRSSCRSTTPAPWRTPAP